MLGIGDRVLRISDPHSPISITQKRYAIYLAMVLELLGKAVSSVRRGAEPEWNEGDSAWFQSHTSQLRNTPRTIAQNVIVLPS